MLDPVIRRRFLIVAIACSGLVTVICPSILGIAKALAQPGAQLDQAMRRTMIRMARLLYPHEAIPDSVYAEAFDQMLSSIAGDPSFVSTLQAAERALNAQQQTNWIDLDEASQIAAMKAIESTDAFITIRFAIQVKFYNHPAVWVLLGYEGPSFERGGYLNQGAGVIDWLPQGR